MGLVAYKRTGSGTRRVGRDWWQGGSKYKGFFSFGEGSKLFNNHDWKMKSKFFLAQIQS
jgi:hypothetical protein